MSHHDAAEQTDSNRLLFNRQRMLLPLPTDKTRPSQQQVDGICRMNPVPKDLAPIASTLPFPQFIASAIMRLFIEEYGRRNSGDGEGLFSGIERYSRLEARVKTSATSAGSLLAFWDRLCQQMGVGIHSQGIDGRLTELFGVPTGLGLQVLRAFAEHSRTVVMVARTWVTLVKGQSAAYSEAAGTTQVDGGSIALDYQAEGIELGSAAAQVVDAPNVSSNGIRRVMVREPAWRHLARHLGLEAAKPGEGDLPAAVEAIFVNGGNIKAGAKQESAAFSLAADVRKLYPSLDLLGGVCNSFDLGTSMVRVNACIVSKETKELGCLADDVAALPSASVSIFDMLDDVTATRQAHKGEGQMIYSFETLLQGAQIQVSLAVDPFVQERTLGALECALREYMGGSPVVGGQSARGFGSMAVKVLETPENAGEAAALYEAYLVSHREALLDGMKTGTLGTKKKVAT